MTFFKRLSAALLLLLAGFGSAAPALAEDSGAAATAGGPAVQVYLFWQEGCPHCAKAMRYLESLQEAVPAMRLHDFEVTTSGPGQTLFATLLQRHGMTRAAVPFVVVGDRSFMGYDTDETTGRAMAQQIAACLEVMTCPDTAGAVLQGILAAQDPGQALGARQESPIEWAPPSNPLPRSVDLPFIGETALAGLSLPLLTLVLGAADGFNPCAMWVLIFLIGLLLGLRDHWRMWVLGGAFLLASGLVYFLFMTAWLNFFLLLGAVIWIRIGIGLFALAVGAWYLREFVVNPGDVCPVTSPGQRRRIMDRLKAAVAERRLALALPMVILVAVAVNLVELLCSAGLPAVYTQVLSLSDLPPWQHYGYLLLYVIVFMLDDLLVFATAMVTLHATGLTARYSRASHLIGGVVIAAIGVLLLVRPEWLSFGI